MPRDVVGVVHSASHPDDAAPTSFCSSTMSRLRDAIAAAGESSLQQDPHDSIAERRLYARAVRILTARGCSCSEMRAKLRASPSAVAQGIDSFTTDGLVDEEIVNQVVLRLQRAGYLDDVAYAQSVSRSRLERGASRLKVLRELARRGIDEQVAQDGLAHALAESVGSSGAAPEDDEHRRCRELGRIRLLRMQDLPAATQQRRLAAYLARRGYALELVHSVVRELGGEEATG